MDIHYMYDISLKYTPKVKQKVFFKLLMNNDLAPYIFKHFHINTNDLFYFEVNPFYKNKCFCSVFNANLYSSNPLEKWKISKKNGYIKVDYTHELIYNFTDFRLIRQIFKTLFYIIIKLKCIIHRLRNRKKGIHLFFLGTTCENSQLTRLRNSTNAIVKKTIYDFI